MGHGLTFDIAHLLAGGLVLVSFLMITQHRLYALLNAFALQALLLSMSVAWQANVQHAPHLYVTAVIALVFKAIIVPVGLHRIIQRLGIHREIETVIAKMRVFRLPDFVGGALMLGLLGTLLLFVSRSL